MSNLRNLFLSKTFFYITLVLSHIVMLLPYALYIFFLSFVNPSADQPETLYSNRMILFLIIVFVFILASFIINLIVKSWYGILISLLTSLIFIIIFLISF